MMRDMDTIRTIALAVAASPPGTPISSASGIDPATFDAHAQWMTEGGLIVSSATEPEDARTVVIWRLTWAGCDFVDAVRSDTLWAKARVHVLKPAASWTFKTLLDWLQGQIGDQLGNLLS